MDRLSILPSETLWQVLSYLTVHDLSCIRLVSKKLALFADHPSHWRHLHLAPPQQYEEEQKVVSFSSSSLKLWSLKDLQRLIGPHRRIIESIQIWGVRDNIVRYILSHCVNLTDLTLCGWATLSDHAFKHLHPELKLHRLMLVGAQEQPNYTAMDATTLAHLLMQCPLKELSLGCQVHIHAQTLLMELNKQQLPYKSSKKHNLSLFTKSKTTKPPLHLQRLTLATRRTWSTEHVMALFDTCPSLHHVCLFPAAAAGGFDLAQTKKMGEIMDHQQELQMDGAMDMMIHRSTERTVEWLA
ncbi:uncharacterized protein BX664DRAFT_319185 [Halteromyces radiatus]|uniref:uncharacterized protein n=1 Tax=Halteromyces radiatus TaxID=101107 RepID=UPI00221EEC3F|nr:uncharacterized protein BX664DRAFT_319185 [Halteromyces radiatus]KAI8098621.1 hypothetical protein BX664DRAFT_319185 [Halteromyces radiatus]